MCSVNHFKNNDRCLRGCSAPSLLVVIIFMPYEYSCTENVWLLWEVKSIWSSSQFTLFFPFIEKVGTLVYYNWTTRFPFKYNEKVSDASELTPRNQIIIPKSPHKCQHYQHTSYQPNNKHTKLYNKRNININIWKDDSGIYFHYNVANDPGGINLLSRRSWQKICGKRHSIFL